MRNIEIKAHVRDVEDFGARLAALKPKSARVLDQEDVFFRAVKGRLKLRILGPKSGELIYYARSDAPGPKTSNYEIFRTSEPAKLRAVLTAGFGVRGIVKKVRLAALIGQTRVHLDVVRGLGTFAELEVVLKPKQTASAGTAIARGLMKKLGIASSDLVAGAYLDLLEKKSARASRG